MYILIRSHKKTLENVGRVNQVFLYTFLAVTFNCALIFFRDPLECIVIIKQYYYNNTWISGTYASI